MYIFAVIVFEITIKPQDEWKPYTSRLPEK